MSREFRALVTSIRVPLEIELADRTALSAERRERLQTIHRDFTRLLQLVNTVFDLAESKDRRASAGLVDPSAKTIIMPRMCDDLAIDRPDQHPSRDDRGPDVLADPVAPAADPASRAGVHRPPRSTRDRLP